MLDLAAASGIKVIDTAAAYGESESALGRALGPGPPVLTRHEVPAAGRAAHR